MTLGQLKYLIQIRPLCRYRLGTSLTKTQANNARNALAHIDELLSQVSDVITTIETDCQEEK